MAEEITRESLRPFCFLLLVCRYQKLWKENWSQEVGVDALEFKTGPVLFKSSSVNLASTYKDVGTDENGNKNEKFSRRR